MSYNSINKFILRTILAAIPLIIIVAIYLILDPFKVVRYYYPYFEPETWETWLGWNKNWVSVTAYEQGREENKYDSFIFGSSISIAYKTDEWGKYLPTNASPFHFDGTEEDIKGILDKMQYIDKLNDTIRHALIVLEPNTFRNRPTKNFLRYTPPQIGGWETYLDFHCTYFRQFINSDFLKSYIPFKITGESIIYGEKDIFPKQQLLYNKATNEEGIELMEGKIDNNPDSVYQANEMDRFPIHKLHYCQPMINDTLRFHLTKISEILKKHNCDYYIVFGPNRKREILHSDDQKILSEIFIPERIYRYTAIDTITDDKPYFYDNNHYRTFVCSAILDSIYNNQSAKAAIAVE